MHNFGGMISFALNASSMQVAYFVSATKLFALDESLGGVESLIEQPSTMTHASIPQEKPAQLRISDQLVRLSVGIECVEDLIADLEFDFSRLQ